ncbi:MAG: hypothetical protein AAF591_12465 [Verrucomicrobiota bacterium]
MVLTTALPTDHHFVWSKGFALRADHPDPVTHAEYVNGVYTAPFPPDAYQNINDNDLVWIRSNDVGRFAGHVLPHTSARFTLLSGDEDVAHPADPLLDNTEFGLSPEDRLAALTMLDDPRLIAWFAQNASHPPHPSGKLHYLPVGLDLHTGFLRDHWGIPAGTTPAQQEQELIQTAEQAPPFPDRIPKAFAAWSNNNSKDVPKIGLLDRDSLAASFQNNPVVDFDASPSLSRLEIWRRFAQYQFIIAPIGHGFDTHRLWEALILGCIVIAQTSPVSPYYHSLPITNFSHPNEVNAASLHQWASQITPAQHTDSRLAANHWIDKACNHPHT